MKIAVYKVLNTCAIYVIIIIVNFVWCKVFKYKKHRNYIELHCLNSESHYSSKYYIRRIIYEDISFRKKFLIKMNLEYMSDISRGKRIFCGRAQSAKDPLATYFKNPTSMVPASFGKTLIYKIYNRRGGARFRVHLKNR